MATMLIEVTPAGIGKLEVDSLIVVDPLPSQGAVVAVVALVSACAGSTTLSTTGFDQRGSVAVIALPARTPFKAFRRVLRLRSPSITVSLLPYSSSCFFI